MSKKGYGAILIFLATTFPTGGCAPSGDVTSSGPYDVIITNARIIDGTGNPWYRGDVGIRGKRIAAIGDLSGADANRTIDAGGKPVTPGFIDLHSHASWSFLVDSRAASAVTQGITLVVEGEGGSVAPTSERYLAEKMSSFERRGITPDWQTLGQFFDRLEASPATINFGTFVGTSTLREIVVGTEDRPASEEERAEMERLAAEAMEDGAFGVYSALMKPYHLGGQTALAKTALRHHHVGGRDRGSQQ